MTGSESDAILMSAYSFLFNGDPIPLSWAIEHGDAVPEAWAISDEPVLMTKLMVFLVDRPTLVITVADVVRRVLPFVRSTQIELITEAIETAERAAAERAANVAAPRVTSDDLWAIAMDLERLAKRKPSHSDDFPLAARFLALLLNDQGDVIWTASRAVSCALRTDDTSVSSNARRQHVTDTSEHEVANTLRRHLPVVMLTDLLQAGGRP